MWSPSLSLPSLLYSTSLLFTTTLAIGQKPTVNFDGNGLELASSGSAVRIMCAQNDFPGVLRVCDDLALDFGRVTGTNGSVSVMGDGPAMNASMIFNITGMSSFEMQSGGAADGGVIIAGTMGNSSLIDGMVEQGKIDVSAIEGEWEAYVSAVVDSPMEGVERAMVIAGSNRRGTIYGMYSVSEQIGVSPWYWFADSAPQQHSDIYATDTTVVQGSPSVKYRGFFLNDEAPALTGYIMGKYEPSPWGPGYGSGFYHSVFELLLRLRANYLWPAQWNEMFNVDDPRSQPMADEYGIVMGTSHTEPMMRATKEWNEFGDGDWQFNTNNQSIIPFFREGAERAQPYEGVLTMGMRGSGDTALAPGIETDLLESVVAAQTRILDDIWGEAAVENPDIVPQMWCLYKEVQGYYEAGMRVPDYITLLWAEDNWGNNRRLPIGNETERAGGAGVYYHFDYVGDPRDYKWINTVQLEKTWEQMHLAYERQARRIWIVNVGDLKPLELPISHFMDLAYDISLYDKDSTSSWLESWAAREFGPDAAAETARIMSNYSMAAGRRKYELIDPATYSIINYNEAERILAQWSAMAASADSVMQSLRPEARDAFFEMVYHPVNAGYIFNNIMISTARNNLYAGQGRSHANAVADMVRDLFEQDHELTVRYNSLLDGKWAHIMDQTHYGYKYWQQPMRQALPGLQYVAASERGLVGDLAVAIQGSNASVPGDDMYHDLSSNTLEMYPFDPYGVSSQWIDIFATGTGAPTNWNISANASWVSFSQSSGTLAADGSADAHVWVTVDWDSVPSDVTQEWVLVNISTTPNDTTLYSQQTQYGTQYAMPQLMLPINNTRVADGFGNGFVESDGHISIEAEHWSSPIEPASAGDEDLSYQILPGAGRTLSGVTLFPVTAASQTTDSAPGLQYNLFTFTEPSYVHALSENGKLNITLLTTTSLNTIPDRPLKYAVQLDDQDVQEVVYIEDQPEGANPTGWGDAVANNAWTSTTRWEYSEAGEHVLRLWALEPGVVMTGIWVDLGGVRDSYLGPPESYRMVG